MTGKVHIIGAGVAGLSAATSLTAAGYPVGLYEAAPQAGGRCRSFYDDQVGATIDNGTHLVLSGNTSVLRYLDRIGAVDRLIGPREAVYRFMDLQTSERWQVNLGQGRLPASLLLSSNRPPGVSVFDFLRIFNSLNAKPDSTIEQLFQPGSIFVERFWGPVCLAVLNTPLREAAVDLMVPVVRETMMRGGGACRPMLARESLSNTFIEPALAYVASQNCRFGARLRQIERSNGDVTLRFAEVDIELAPADVLIVAAPSWASRELLPDITVPDCHEPIVNAHFSLAETRGSADRPNGLHGFTGGMAEWASIRGNVVSVTVSAARSLVDLDAAEIATRLWQDIQPILGDPNATVVPAYRVIKERRATFSQTPGQCAKRPASNAAGDRILLAGDWTDTGLPATIEGALRSGENAASRAIEMLRLAS